MYENAGRETCTEYGSGLRHGDKRASQVVPPDRVSVLWIVNGNFLPPRDVASRIVYIQAVTAAVKHLAGRHVHVHRHDFAKL